MSILLFKFPSLVIAEIIRSMNPRDIFITSLASSRTKKVIMTSMTRTRYPVESLRIYDTAFYCHLMKFKIKAEQDPTNQEASTYKIGSSSYKVVIRPTIISIFWTQPSENINCAKNLMTHISETFKKPTVRCLSMNIIGMGEPNLNIIRHSKPLFPLIEQIRYSSDTVSPEVFIETFEELGTSNSLFLNTRLPDNFEYSPSSPDHFQMGHLIFKNEILWMKLDDYMECKKIDMVDCTSRYNAPATLNAFIKKWIDADCRLETLQARFRLDFDFPAIANGLGEIQQEQDGHKQFVEFEGVNGKKAEIFKSGQMFYMKVRK